MGDDSYGINRAVVERIVAEIAEVSAAGCSGGNCYRRR